jgi:NAD(P)-dependent dehydrogenase (short-subunit alcohol dehydrogenase family)
MDIVDKVVVVTGGGNGIGKALSTAFSRAGARAVAVVDLDLAAARQVADAIGGRAFYCDVRSESEVQELVAAVEQLLGPIDIFCSNAGIITPDDANSAVATAANDAWQRSWEVHVMSHVYAARAVIPGMVERGGGYLVNTASAAGLLQQIGDSAYSTTKHAAVGFAEAMAIAHGDQGIKVSVVCPQYVATRMIGAEEGQQDGLAEGVITAAEAADIVLAGIRDERFLILTHEQVADYWSRKHADYDRWLGGMRKLRRTMIGEGDALDLGELHKSDKLPR